VIGLKHPAIKGQIDGRSKSVLYLKHNVKPASFSRRKGHFGILQSKGTPEAVAISFSFSNVTHSAAEGKLLRNDPMIGFGRNCSTLMRRVDGQILLRLSLLMKCG
jgi:hypothetical protein